MQKAELERRKTKFSKDNLLMDGIKTFTRELPSAR